MLICEEVDVDLLCCSPSFVCTHVDICCAVAAVPHLAMPVYLLF